MQAVYRTLGGRPTGRDPGDWMPMFGVLWPGAVALARRVDASDLRGERVLELGCGLGLPSLVAAAQGARVLATDNHPHAAAFLAANAHHNGVSIDWRHLDWRDLPQDLGRFDRVIASDLLFSADLAPLVAQTLAATLAPHGRAWLVDPGRLALPVFEAAALDVGLSCTIEVFVEERGEEPVELYAIDLRW